LEAEKQPDPQGSLKEKLWKIVFEAETPKGRLFDIALLWLIALSVLVIMLESVPELKAKHRVLFLTLEWFFTIVFTIEYFLRIWLTSFPVYRPTCNSSSPAPRRFWSSEFFASLGSFGF